MATHNNNFHAHLPIFEGKNYDQWIVKMKVIFRYQDVFEVVNDGVPALAGNTTDVQHVANKDAKKDGKAMRFLRKSCIMKVQRKLGMH